MLTLTEEQLDWLCEQIPDAPRDPRGGRPVADKGYHSNAVLTDDLANVRTYIAEPDRGRRDWEGKAAEPGRRLMWKRGELLERSFAHCYDTGGMRRTHLRGHENILKRLLIHTAGFNLSLVLRPKFGVGTARGLQGLFT